jgi:cytochrome c-type biogenesis protein CcmE
MNIKYIIGIVIIIIFVIVGATAFLNTTVRYVPYNVALKSASKVQVMGKIDYDQVVFDKENTRLAFTIYDPEASSPQGAKQLKAVYYGPVPSTFDQATSVVLIGQADSTGTFVADQMLLKCPSKYQGLGGEFRDNREHDEAVAEDGR